MGLFSSTRREGASSGSARREDPSNGSAPRAATHPERLREDQIEEVVDPDAIYDPDSRPPDGGDAQNGQPAPDLARAALGVLGHTGRWAAGAYFHAGRRVAGVVVAPASGITLARDIATETTRALLNVADATELERRLDEAGPAGALVKRAASVAGQLLPVNTTDLIKRANSAVEVRHEHHHNGRPPTLREQGEELLRRSRDVNDHEDTHPAYNRILSELAPDEARLLSLMLVDGPQATVDVRTGGPLGLINSRLIKSGMSMIGARAGCRYVDRVPSYLNNLFRLGLIWFSRETLRDHQRYQVLEAQPDVLAAIHSVTAAKVVRRSVHLTPFGEDFCRMSLSDGVRDLNVLPEHSAPKDLDTVPQPPTETVEG
jgi:hypothetical protein